MFKNWHKRQFEFLYNYKAIIKQSAQNAVQYGQKELQKIYSFLKKRNINYDSRMKTIIIPSGYNYQNDKDLMILKNHYGYQFINGLF